MIELPQEGQDPSACLSPIEATPASVPPPAPRTREVFPGIEKAILTRQDEDQVRGYIDVRKELARLEEKRDEAQAAFFQASQREEAARNRLRYTADVLSGRPVFVLADSVVLRIQLSGSPGQAYADREIETEIIPIATGPDGGYIR